jgi:hypothetical protein
VKQISGKWLVTAMVGFAVFLVLFFQALNALSR